MDVHHPVSTTEPDLSGYRPVSRLAIVALALGVVSALSLVSPFFLVVPLVALAVAVVALADVERDGAEKAGRLAALAGLALATGFATQAVAAGVVARSIASSRAGAVAELFFTAVREGRVADAEAMCQPEARAAVARLAACAGRSECRKAVAGDDPGTWVVRIVPADPGGCTARIVLAPELAEQQRRSFERWLVMACEVDEPVVRPSGT